MNTIILMISKASNNLGSILYLSEVVDRFNGHRRTDNTIERNKTRLKSKIEIHEQTAKRLTIILHPVQLDFVRSEL